MYVLLSRIQTVKESSSFFQTFFVQQNAQITVQINNGRSLRRCVPPHLRASTNFWIFCLSGRGRVGLLVTHGTSLCNGTHKCEEESTSCREQITIFCMSGRGRSRSLVTHVTSLCNGTHICEESTFWLCPVDLGRQADLLLLYVVSINCCYIPSPRSSI